MSEEDSSGESDNEFENHEAKFFNKRK